MIHHTDLKKCTIDNDQGECVGVFLPIEVQKFYKLRDPEERINTKFVVIFYEFHDTSRLLASWWKEDKKFINRRNDWYNTVNLKEPYMDTGVPHLLSVHVLDRLIFGELPDHSARL
jgi:hypothetical protein